MYLKLVFAILILASASILTDFNSKSGMMVSANPKPGHSQLEYYKRAQKSRDRQGRRVDESPWAQEYRFNHAKSVNHASSIVPIIVATVIKMIYA